MTFMHHTHFDAQYCFAYRRHVYKYTARKWVFFKSKPLKYRIILDYVKSVPIWSIEIRFDCVRICLKSEVWHSKAHMQNFFNSSNERSQRYLISQIVSNYRRGSSLLFERLRWMVILFSVAVYLKGSDIIYERRDPSREGTWGPNLSLKLIWWLVMWYEGWNGISCCVVACSVMWRGMRKCDGVWCDKVVCGDVLIEYVKIWGVKWFDCGWTGGETM